MTSLRAVLFDIDDTLYSSTDFAWRAREHAVEAMQARGLEPEALNKFKLKAYLKGNCPAGFTRATEHKPECMPCPKGKSSD